MNSGCNVTVFGILSPSNSQVMKIDIFNLVLRKNDRGPQLLEHTKFDGDLCRYKIARAANVSNLPIAVESMPLEQSG